MQPDEIKSYGCVAKWLTAAELALYESEVYMPSQEEKNVLKNLAATRELSEQRRELMVEHQWSNRNTVTGEWACPSCHRFDHQGHAPDCAWDAALKGEGE